jgi:DNA-binding transcriptional LysR family regulator
MNWTPDRVKIEDVRAFVAVVESGSVGRAALRLKLTQPAISRRVQRMEAALGVCLLDRDSKPARPTPAGEAAYGRCMAVLRAMQALSSNGPGAPSPGPLRIGITLGLAEAVVVPAVEALRQHDPHAALHLTTGRSRELKKQVADGGLDAAVVFARGDRGHDEPGGAWLGIERVAIVAGVTLPCPPRCGLADLAHLPWVINPDGCGFRTQLDRSLAQRGQSLEVAAETWGHGLQLALIAQGTGLGLIPRRLIGESPHISALRIIDVHDFRPALSVWVTRTPAMATSATLDVLTATVRERLDDGPTAD